MALSKQTILDAVTIRPTGDVEIRTALIAFDDDGTEIGRRNNRRVIAPTDDITNEPAKIRQICQIARS